MIERFALLGKEACCIVFLSAFFLSLPINKGK